MPPVWEKMKVCCFIIQGSESEQGNGLQGLEARPTIRSNIRVAPMFYLIWLIVRMMGKSRPRSSMILFANTC